MPLPPTPSFHPLADPQAIVRAGKARFTVLTGRLIRIEYSPNETFEERPSQVFWNRQQPLPVFTTQHSAGKLTIETDALILRYRPSPFGLTPLTLSIQLKQNQTTWRYGAPARFSGNLQGTARTLDGDAGATRLEDGLLSKAGWAVVDDSHSLVFNQAGWLEPRKAARRQKDLYFFGYATDAAGCLGDFTRLAGAIPMIPRYILGNWWSRYWAYSQAELQELMEDFRAYEVPLSVCIVDMDWHITRTGNRSSGWTGYTWNNELFPDPPGFIDWLHRQGLRTALNLHPALGIHPHEAQYAAMARWMGIDPASKQPVAFDISDPRFVEGYLELLHHPYEAEGVDFWWMDWQQGRKSRLPGLDPLWWINHLHYYDLGRDGRKRPFIFSRWGGLGNHRYPIGFSGDTFVRWSTLAFQPRFTAAAANVAYGWWSHDIGGHMFKDQSPELYLRWVQFGVFSPIFRLHSTNKPELDRRPWGKPERYFKAARQAMQLRHALIPYIYSMAWRAHRSGVSLVTPVYYAYPHEPEAYQARDQVFFGSELLAAPVLAPANAESGKARKRVWFPPGLWRNFFTGEQIEGAAWREIEAALEDIPVYAKAGAIVPLAPKVGWGGLENPLELDLHVFPGADNRFELYEDDGESTDYLRGRFAITPFSLEGQVFTIHAAQGDLSVIPAQRDYRIHLHGVDQTLRASHPGAYDPTSRTFSSDTLRLAARERFSFEFTGG
jgi:alpha-glucosidase (family GH31 glycosyl hydrolase)